MTRSIVLGICVCVLVGAVGCSGDDDEGGAGSAGAGGSDGSGMDGSGASGTGSGASGTGSGTGSSGSGAAAGDSGGGDAGSSGSASGDAGTSGTVDPNALLLCGGEACACADGVDNDGDDTLDGFDVECTGPYDDDESSFATGISGDNKDGKWQDCFFDGNSGAGEDDCRYHTDCLTGDLPQDHADCSLSQSCLEFCAELTPPGCDCFGCCTIAGEDGPRDVITDANCDSSDLASCTSCVKSEDCDNECGECELCTGVTVNDLPDECFEEFPPTAGSGGSGGSSGSSGSSGSGGVGGSSGSGGTDEPPPVYVCDDNARLCRVQSECPPGYYCQLGCCKVIGPE